jgi:transcriptional regulator
MGLQAVGKAPAMHPNPVFRKTPQDRSVAFAHDRGFGVLMVNGPQGPLAAHVPFLLSEAADRVDLHLVRSNPIARAMKEGGAVQALLAVSGPDAYVSPDWYGLPDQVPTWNYVAVDLRGTLALAPDGELRGILDALSARFEAPLAPKTPWTADKMTDGVMERMMRQIVPVWLTVSQIDSTWKLTQNKVDSARLGAADGIEAAGMGTDPMMLARLMRAVPASE